VDHDTAAATVGAYAWLGVLMLLIAAAQAGPDAADPKDVDIKIALGLHACGWGSDPPFVPPTSTRWTS